MCIGLYGTVAFNASRRTNEIGIRMTLGVTRGHIVWIVLRDIVLMTAIGAGVGVPLALAGSRYIQTLLFGLGPRDPATIAIAVMALTLCAMLAGLIPARRAAGIDPMTAIRHGRRCLAACGGVNLGRIDTACHGASARPPAAARRHDDTTTRRAPQ